MFNSISARNHMPAAFSCQPQIALAAGFGGRVRGSAMNPEASLNRFSSCWDMSAYKLHNVIGVANNGSEKQSMTRLLGTLPRQPGRPVPVGHIPRIPFLRT